VHEKERIIFLMHSTEALLQAYPEYMKRRRAPRGASSLACRSGIEICGRGVERGVSQRQFPTYGSRLRPCRQQNVSYYTKISRRCAWPGSL